MLAAIFAFITMGKIKTAETPLMQQHKAIKAKYPDAILLFRVGDFYETFGQDAVIASQVLGITLTKRNNGGAADNELAGFPHHALDTYLHMLVNDFRWLEPGKKFIGIFAVAFCNKKFTGRNI